MNERLRSIISDSDGRYLTKEEMKEILAWTTSLPARFKAAANVEEKELAIARWVIDDLKRRYPNFTKYHYQGWEKGSRDLQLTLRAAAQAMILNDITNLEDKVLFWFRTILSGVDLTPKFVSESFTLLRDACKQQLAAESFTLLEPYLTRMIEVLADIPEPAVPAV